MGAQANLAQPSQYRWASVIIGCQSHPKAMSGRVVLLALTTLAVAEEFEVGNATEELIGHHCTHYTGGTCKHFGCHSWRGPTSCVHGECVCKPDHCAIEGRCMPKRCKKKTGGSCMLFGCDESRGETRCYHGSCRCVNGCAIKGVCHSWCPHKTGGSCSFADCGESRHSVCSGGECVCPRGTCSERGACRSAPYVMEEVEEEEVVMAANEGSSDNLGPTLLALAAFAAGSAMVLYAMKRNGQASNEEPFLQ
eukprot:NODE_2645_length_898_cov_400.902728.p1 GENE.NODE_2645_length_898_cov_400.902728~~NODE_2645_length_898_cov_400.902728.p1  ORF type:complete len:251 (+),score=27.22 NODE_2645_length_898_cov_400.902728:3-755(+)